MTREEAIKTLTSLKEQYEIAVSATEHVGIKAEFKDAYDAINTALAALRGPTREQVRMGMWIRELTPQKLSGRTISHCSKCWHHVFWPNEHTNFCPDCGMPMTDEAVEITLQRLEALYGKP